MPFSEIAPIVDRDAAAARQLASRARRRVRRAGDPRPTAISRQCEVVEAFLAASRQGDFRRLIASLDPAVVFRAIVAFTIVDGLITRMDLVVDPERLKEIRLPR